MLKSILFKACLLAAALVFCLSANGFPEQPCRAPYDCPQNISTVPKTVKYTSRLGWDPANPREMDRNSSVTVKITGGLSPYSWTVSGTGFSLATDVTQGLSNSLVADDFACSAEITVEDSRNDKATGYMKYSGGGWQEISAECVLAGKPADDWNVDNIGSWLDYIYPVDGYVIAGHQKQTQSQQWVVNATSPGTWDNEADCEQARFTDCGASYSGPCLAYPSSLELDVPGGSYRGHYDRCLDTRRYPRECTEDAYGNWSYVSAWINTDYSIKYFEWICP